MIGHRTRAWVGRAITVVALVGGAILAGGMPAAQAAAPLPRLSDCLARGSFDIGDSACPEPVFGPRYGHIDGVQVVQVTRGRPVQLAYSSGDIDFERPTRACGDRGCPYNRMYWVTAVQNPGGLSLQRGCGDKDIDCSMVYAPSGIGDAGEVVAVVIARHFDGIYVVGGQAFVLYAPPLIYPASIQALDTSGQRLDVPGGYVAYAVRAGANPTAAQCLPADWQYAAATGPTVPVPDCVTFPQWALLTGEDPKFLGYLPADSGTWTIVGHPQGDAAAPLLARPSPYRHATITMGHDDLAGTIIGESRPRLSMDLQPETSEMALGDTQTVTVTVSAVGGEAGDLQDLRFDDPSVLGVTDGGPLAVVGVAEALPTAFTLDRGESRTFRVTVQAVSLGRGAIGGAIGGYDDIGGPARAEVAARAIGVEPGEVGGGPNAPEPPLVTRAVVGTDGAAGPVEGTVKGAPGSSVRVSLFSALAGGLDCAQLLDGPGITSVGSFGADIGDDGTGAFAGTADLQPRAWLYGVTVTADGVSRVGDCHLVAEATPTLSVQDAEVAEGTNKKDATDLVFGIDLSSPSESEVRVHVATADGTATAPADYAAVATDVTIPAGQVHAEVRVPVVSDGKTEEDEELTLTLSAPVSAVLDPDGTTATGTITDPDDQGASVIDLRGDWSVVEKPADPALRESISITSQDRSSGDWKGKFIGEILKGDPPRSPSCRGRVCTYKVTGTIRGNKVTVRIVTDGPTLKFSGTLRDKGGTRTVTLSGTGLTGRTGTLILTRKDRS